MEFDRGTILLNGFGGAETARPPGISWDARVSGYRAPAASYRELAGWMRSNDAECDDIVMRGDSPPGEWCPLQLRPYQHEALDAWRNAGGRGVVVLPTGAGKTHVAIAAMARMRRSVLCLVPTRVLLGQWVESLSSSYDGAVGCLGDGIREVRPVTAATFESAFRAMPRIGNRFDMLVVDEVHHLGGALRPETLALCAARWRLGLTATLPVGHEYRRELRRQVGDQVFELELRAITGKFVAPYERVLVTVDLAPEERAVYESERALYRRTIDRLRMEQPGASWGELSRIACRSSRGRRAMAAWRRVRRLLGFPRAKARVLGELLDRHRDVRTLVFTSGNDATFAIARNELVAPFTCEIRRAERNDLLRRFERGELRALVSAQVLNEGLDVSSAEVAIVVAGQYGEREHVQRLGRLLRMRGDKRAVLYELITRNTVETRQAHRRSRSIVP